MQFCTLEEAWGSNYKIFDDNYSANIVSPKKEKYIEKKIYKKNNLFDNIFIEKKNKKSLNYKNTDTSEDNQTTLSEIETFTNNIIVNENKKNKKNKKKINKFNKKECLKIIKYIEDCPSCKKYVLEKYLLQYSLINKFKYLLKPEYRETIILSLVGLIILLIINLIFF